MFIRVDNLGNILAISIYKLQNMGEVDNDALPEDFIQKPYLYTYKDGLFSLKPKKQDNANASTDITNI